MSAEPEDSAVDHDLDLMPYKYFDRVSASALDSHEDSDSSFLKMTDNISQAALHFNVHDEPIINPNNPSVGELQGAIPRIFKKLGCRVKEVGLQDEEGLIFEIDFPQPMTRTAALDMMKRAYDTCAEPVRNAEIARLKTETADVFDAICGAIQRSEMSKNVLTPEQIGALAGEILLSINIELYRQSRVGKPSRETWSR